jgi:hypothetical protein
MVGGFAVGLKRTGGLVQIFKSSYSYSKGKSMSKAKFKTKLPLEIAVVSKAKLMNCF